MYVPEKDTDSKMMLYYAQKHVRIVKCRRQTTRKRDPLHSDPLAVSKTTRFVYSMQVLVGATSTDPSTNQLTSGAVGTELRTLLGVVSIKSHILP